MVGGVLFPCNDVSGWDDDVIKTNVVVMLDDFVTELLFIPSILTVLLL